MVRECSWMSSLAKFLTPGQLMLVMKASIQPVVQLNTTVSFLDPPVTTTHKIDMLQDWGERVKLTMVPGAEAVDIKNKKMNSPNRLLAATDAYRILKMLTDGTTQRAMQERYKVQAKQLSLCITGKCYLSRMDCKALMRKRRASEGNGGPSSKKPTSQ